MNISSLQSVVNMEALDKLLAQSLSTIIKKQLGASTCQKVESRLKERYGLDLVDSIKEFYTLDATLREFFGAGADALEEDFLNHLISLQSGTKGRQWLTIENQDLARLILESYGHREKRLILDAAFKKPNAILEILDACNIPRSSGYRIINELVEDGLLTEEGYSETSDGKKVSKYTSLFEKVKIEIEREGMVIQIMLKENILNESNIIKILRRGK